MTRERDYIIVGASGRPAPSLALIKAMVSDHYYVSLLNLDSGRRDRTVVRPRQVVMYLARHLTKLSLPDIGRRLGDRDHTTVLHGVRTIERLRHEDGDLANDLRVLTDRLAA